MKAITCMILACLLNFCAEDVGEQFNLVCKAVISNNSDEDIQFFHTLYTNSSPALEHINVSFDDLETLKQGESQALEFSKYINDNGTDNFGYILIFKNSTLSKHPKGKILTSDMCDKCIVFNCANIPETGFEFIFMGE